MRRVFLITALIAVLAFPAFSEFRLDLGLDVPFVAGFIGGGDVGASDVGSTLSHPFPFPEIGAYYQFDLGPLSLAPGVRFFSFILESVLWPNLLAEFQLGPVFVDAQLGGLVFVMFGLVNDVEAGAVLIPDLSVWLGLGKKKMFRVGAGAIGLLLPEVSSDMMLFAGYVGFKVSLNP